MKAGRAQQIIRQLAGPTARIFNDRLSNGARSFKVWGWNRDMYVAARDQLLQQGIGARLVDFQERSSWVAHVRRSRGLGLQMKTRLHVWDKE